MFENPRRPGRQARNFTTNVPKILGLNSPFVQIFSRKMTLGAPDFCGLDLLVKYKTLYSSFLFLTFRIFMAAITTRTLNLIQLVHLPFHLINSVLCQGMHITKSNVKLVWCYKLIFNKNSLYFYFTIHNNQVESG